MKFDWKNRFFHCLKVVKSQKVKGIYKFEFEYGVFTSAKSRRGKRAWRLACESIFGFGQHRQWKHKKARGEGDRPCFRSPSSASDSFAVSVMLPPSLLPAFLLDFYQSPQTSVMMSPKKAYKRVFFWISARIEMIKETWEKWVFSTKPILLFSLTIPWLNKVSALVLKRNVHQIRRVSISWSKKGELLTRLPI